MNQIIMLCALFSMSSFGKLVEWETSESQKRFNSSNYKTDFFRLSNNFTSQDNKIACGLASSSIIMNSIKLRKSNQLPEDKSSITVEEMKNIPTKFNPFFEKFTQFNILNSKTKNRKIVFGQKYKESGLEKRDFGLQLSQLGKIFEVYGVNVTKKVVTDKLTKVQVVEDIKRNLTRPKDFVLVNYARKILGQKGGGHISPIGAYDQASDSFLVMDVNPNKAPWVWVKADLLVKAMNTFDTKENRGYLLINE